MPKDARRMAVNFAKLPVFYNPRGEAFAFAKEVKGAFGCRDISSQNADRVGLSMTLMVQTCLMLQQHFLMLSAKSWSCEKRARTTIRLW